MDPDKYARDYNDLLRFSADHSTVEALLKTLSSHPDHLEPNSNARMVTADALDENGRESEGKLLRSEHPIYTHNGHVYQHSGHFPSPRTLSGSGLDQFRRAYKEAAVWSSTDDEGNPLDRDFSHHDLHPDTDEEMDRDADHFYHSFHHLFGDAVPVEAGHDFWLSRNGHGSGYFAHPDRYGDHTQHLQKQAEKAGEYYLQPDYDEEEPKLTGYGGTSKPWGQEPGLHEHHQ